MRLYPILDAPGSPPSVGPGLRGVAIHWVASGPPTSKRKKFAPLIPEPGWQVRLVPFRALTPDGHDRPPATVTEIERMARNAYAITAAHHPIPSDATVYYEVGGWER